MLESISARSVKRAEASGRRLPIGDEDPLAAARGVVNGVLLSLIIWELMVMAWWVL
jgi:hypothetical protein